MKLTYQHTALALAIVMAAGQAQAQAPEGYYDGIEGKCARELKTELFEIIGDHEQLSYKQLWSAFRDTDRREDGTVWDMYSDCVFEFGDDQCGQYSSVGDCYNREHSFPKSWFDDGYPMYTDLFHLYPTDGRVNGQRGNYPFGECEGGTKLSNLARGRLGNSTFPGYSGRVFEPDDEYKGDFARSYFYMATAYEDRFASFDSEMLAHNSYPCYVDWALELLLKWHRQDPVSQKEVDRNNAVYEWQGNRNPYIDYPQLVEHVWGDKMDEAFGFSNAIDEHNRADIAVTATDGSVTIAVEGSFAYAIYGMGGTVAASGNSEGSTTVALEGKGIYIVKVTNDRETVISKVAL